MSSESSSRRSSLRRLSSLASLHALNPFARRRSHPTSTNASLATSSTLSLASTFHINLSTSSSSSQILPNHDIPDVDEAAPSIPPLPTGNRKSSYICLPDDPIGGMPRSRTFSNLPLPTKARKHSNMTTSKSHSRLPSATFSTAPSLLPDTRIPTPPISTRKHSISHVAPHRRMKRSDTEPLLHYDMGRPTAFKENITPSPQRPPPHRTSTDNRACPSHRARAHQLSQSSPASRARPATPMATSARQDALQRWNSQPLMGNDDGSRPFEHANSRQSPDMSTDFRLSDITNYFPSSEVSSCRHLSGPTDRRHSRHGEIQERRLIGEVKPEIIPPPQTPLGNQALLTSSSRRRANSFQTRQIPESSPSQTSSGPRHTSPERRPTHQITTAEPVAYWCGRFSTLNDQYRNEELLGAVGSPKQDSDRIHDQDANNRRMRRALEYLYGLCATSEARESFVLFQLRLASLQKNSDLGRPIGKWSGPDKLIVLSRLEEGDENERGSSRMDSSPSEARKRNFVHRLIGRAKGERRSLVS